MIRSLGYVSSAGVTGMLLHKDGNLMQVLEGDQAARQLLRTFTRSM